MTKIAIFVEGQSELIFVRTLLLTVINNAKLSFECVKLNKGGRQDTVPYKYSPPNPDVFFLIIDVGNDERVLSAIKEREKTLFENGYKKVLGLRDMYSRMYYERSPGIIRDSLTKDFIKAAQTIIDTMSSPDAVILYFAIMELEAWFLAMYSLFQKINATLSVQNIEQQLGYNLCNIDPQKQFYKPYLEMNRIFGLIGSSYRKSKDELESICSSMEPTDFNNAMENDRCSAFKAFYQEITAWNN